MEQEQGKIQEIAGRIRELRELENISVAEMAKTVDLSPEDYLEFESGRKDLNFTFIYRCANALRVNVTDVIEGYSPVLRSYTMTRAGRGQKISHGHGMTYYNLAYAFQNRIAEPLYVRSVYDEAAQDKPIELTSHDGQECDIVIEGSLKVQVGEHTEILGPGDSMYYDSGTPHGMIAVGGKDCIFYAIVLNPAGEPIPELTQQPIIEEERRIETDDSERIWHEYIDVEENERERLFPSNSRTSSISISLSTLWTRWRAASRRSSRCFISPATARSGASRSRTSGRSLRAARTTSSRSASKRATGSC